MSHLAGRGILLALLVLLFHVAAWAEPVPVTITSLDPRFDQLLEDHVTYDVALMAHKLGGIGQRRGNPRRY